MTGVGVQEFVDQMFGSAPGEAPAHPPAQIALRLTLAIGCGWLLAMVYRRTHTGDRFSAAIPQTQMLLALGGAMIWLVVGDNLVRAFGLAGTIGLIRYRTRIRDPKDTTVLLFSMVVGMACGLGQAVLAIIGTGFVAGTLILLSMTHGRGGGDRTAAPAGDSSAGADD